MKHSIYTSYDELPLMLSVTEVAAVLGISRAGAYELVHGNEFPALKIGSRIVGRVVAYAGFACLKRLSGERHPKSVQMSLYGRKIVSVSRTTKRRRRISAAATVA